MDEERKIAAGEVSEEEKPKTEEKRPAKLEKPPKKPGSVSRFFNQFGIGKYWEKLNDYFEYEEKMEKAVAEKEASKETAEGMKIAAEAEVGAVKERGAEMPAQVENAAARAGAESSDASPVVAEAKAEEAKVEAEAEAAKADLNKEAEALIVGPEAKPPAVEQISPYEFPPESGFKIGDKVQVVRSSGELEPDWKVMAYNSEKMAVVGKTDKNGKLMTKTIEMDVLKDWQKLKVEKPSVKAEAKPPKAEEEAGEEAEITEQKPLLEEMAEKIKAKYERGSLQQIDKRIKDLSDQTRAQDARHEEIVKGLRSGKLYNSAELKAEQENMEEMDQVIRTELDTLEKVRREKTKMAEMGLPSGEEFEEAARVSEAKKKETKKKEPIKAEELPPVEEFEAAEKEHKERAVPTPEKVKPVEVLGEEVIEMPPEIEEIKPVTSKEIEETVKSKKWEIKPPTGFKTRLPEIYSSIEDLEKAFMAKGEKGSRARVERMVSAMEKVGEAYVAQKAAKEMSPKDEKALRKWIAETKGVINALSKPEKEKRPVKAVKLKKRKRAA